MKHSWSTINSERWVDPRSVNRRSNLIWLVMEKPDLTDFSLGAESLGILYHYVIGRKNEHCCVQQMAAPFPTEVCTLWSLLIYSTMLLCQVSANCLKWCSGICYCCKFAHFSSDTFGFCNKTSWPTFFWVRCWHATKSRSCAIFWSFAQRFFDETVHHCLFH